MVKKLKKQYETPNEGWSQERIDREDELIEDYGLKNKKEVYKAQSQLRSLRREARDLVASENEQERKELIEKAHRLGLVREDAELEQILSLNVTDLLDRRLQTAINRRGYTDTVKEARQLVVHGHVYVDGQRVNVPGYLLTQEEEQEIEVIMPEPSEDEAPEEDTEEEIDESEVSEEGAEDSDEEDLEAEETGEEDSTDEEGEETEVEESEEQDAEAETEEETEEDGENGAEQETESSEDDTEEDPENEDSEQEEDEKEVNEQ